MLRDLGPASAPKTRLFPDNATVATTLAAHCDPLLVWHSYPWAPKGPRGPFGHTGAALETHGHTGAALETRQSDHQRNCLQQQYAFGPRLPPLQDSAPLAQSFESEEALETLDGCHTQRLPLAEQEVL